jgi:hypothetical protein
MSRSPPDAFASTARTTRTIRIHCFVFVIENRCMFSSEKQRYHELYIRSAREADAPGATAPSGALRPRLSSSSASAGVAVDNEGSCDRRTGL